MEITKLSNKALQVKLTIKRASLVRKDTTLTDQIQVQQNDASLTVLTKLFRNKASPVYRIMQAVNDVYTYHTANTLPYVDAGPRLLPSGQYFEYSKGMRDLMDKVELDLYTYMPVYDQLVQDDIMYRNNGQAVGRACAADYPTAEEFRARMSFDLKFLPLPDENHPLFDLSDEDRRSFSEHIASVTSAARNDVIQRMLEPLAHLTAKLETPIGESGSVFRDSALENVLEGCRMARKLMIEAEPALVNEIDELERLVQGYSFGASQLRESPATRDDAAARLAAAAAKMKDYFG